MFRKIIFNAKSKIHSSKYINYFTKLSFSLEMHAFGVVIDRFSTSSATKYDYWFFPKSLRNIYLPQIIISTFQKLFLEDVLSYFKNKNSLQIPQLILQLIAISIYSEEINEFTKYTTIATTIANLALSLHTAWNVKPSHFSRPLFQMYHQVLKEEYDKQVDTQEADNQMFSGTSSKFFPQKKEGLSEIENKIKKIFSESIKA